MKKVRIIILFMTLFLGVFFFMPARIFAYTYNPDELGLDFTPYKDNIVFCGVNLEANMDSGPWFYAEKNPIHWSGDPEIYVYIKEIEPNKYFQFNINTDFSPLLESEIRGRYSGSSYFYTGSFIKTEYNRDGMYWNPWLQIWQLEYPVDPEEVNGTAVDWFNHISQFDYGIARSEIFFNGSVFGLSIVEEPSGELAGCKFEYDYYSDEDWIYFKPNLRYLKTLIMDGEFVDGEDIIESLEQNFGQDFDGYLYWNFEEQYWQVEYYGTSELDYYKQRVDELEDEIQQLEDEIQQLEEALVENNDIDIIKWFVPLVVIIIVVGILEPIILLKRRG